jgi:predicted acyl esterase
MKPWILFPFLPITLIPATLAAAQADKAKPAKISRPFHYSGYTKPEFKTSRRFSVYVPMSDGVKLAIDVLVPTGGPDRKAFPVVMQYTPYQRSTIDPKTGRAGGAMEKMFSQYLTSHGYALVVADMRGTGASTGWMLDFMPRIAKDGGELVDWIAKQPWCDGKVGMMGGSYLGWSQIATAGQQPKALKVIIPAVVPLDGYTGEVYPGGIHAQGMVKRWSKGMYYSVRNYYDPEKDRLPTTPVIDEDGDGELADEIPVDVNGNGTFLDDGFPPTYADGQKRKHVYYLATKDHEKDYNLESWAPTGMFIDAATPLGVTAYDLGPSAHVPGVMASGIAVHNVGGWFDGFTRGTFELFCTMRKTNPSRIIIAPAYHDVLGGPFWKYLGENTFLITQQFLAELLRICDRYLKGIENGIDTEPPICIYVMHGGGWRLENEWPLKRQVLTPYMLAPKHALATEPGADGADTYKADYTHDSSYGKNAGNRMLSLTGGTPDTLPIRTEKDKQCLCYTSPPMQKDTEVTGHPILHLHVSSTASHGDFFAYLEDVDPQGQAVLVTEGQLRAGFAKLYNNDKMILGGKHKIDVLPNLPWHGYEKAEYVDGILAGGKVVELVFDLRPTAWVFLKEHRIRLSIACADYPTFRLNPKLSPSNTPDAKDNIVPTITVHRSAPHRSYVELPLIPGR